MKKISMTLAVAAITTIFIGPDLALAGRIVNRQVRQRERIHQGIRSGELTRREAGCLERRQDSIQRHKKIAWSDGKLTPRERALMERNQNRASKNIYRLKHNDAER